MVDVSAAVRAVGSPWRAWCRGSAGGAGAAAAAIRKARASMAMVTCTPADTQSATEPHLDEGAGVLGPQVGAELVVCAGAIQAAFGWRAPAPRLPVPTRNRPVGVPAGAQDVRHDDCVAVVGFAAHDRVPVSAAGERHRVDRVDLASGGAQACGQQPKRCPDRHRDRVIRAVDVARRAGPAARPARSALVVYCAVVGRAAICCVP